MEKTNYIHILLAFILGCIVKISMKNICGQNIEGLKKIDPAKSDYKCGEPGGECVNCGGSTGYYERGGCDSISDSDRKLITKLAGYGPWVPAEGTNSDQCDGGKCGVWCGSRYPVSVPNCNWFGVKDWCFGYKLKYENNFSHKNKLCKYDM